MIKYDRIFDNQNQNLDLKHQGFLLHLIKY